jgi:hypothetical protein
MNTWTCFGRMALVPIANLSVIQAARVITRADGIRILEVGL